jgi:RimJ/RimL family protein N-acetyltransferase
MDKYPKNIKIKNGQNVVLDKLNTEYLDQLADFFQNLPVEDRMYLRFDVTRRENITRRFGTINYDNFFPLIVLHENRIIAQGNIRRAEFGWKRNLGEIRIAVAKDFQRLGLCTILTRELFLYASSTNLYKIQAEIMEGQKSAIAAFERMGFKQEAVLRKHVTDIDNARNNLIIMSLDIQDMWYLLEDFLSDRMYVT